MRGILLAGGMGTRLAPLTKQSNKHMLSVYDRRMIEYPLCSLVNAGIKDIILVTGGNNPEDFFKFLGSGSNYGLNSLGFCYQEGSGGISAALKLAKPFMQKDEECVVILGDNYFEGGIQTIINKFEANNGLGACTYLKHSDRPWDFGIAEVDNGQIISIEEKPKEPKSNFAMLGCYVFDNQVWQIIDGIKPSTRGELEITDVLRKYMEIDQLSYKEYSDFWSDMGSFESLLEVSHRVAQKGKAEV